MNEHTFRVLEFDAIRQRVAAETACSLGGEKAMEMTPSDDVARVQHLLDETTEAREMLAARGPIPLGGITDIRPLVRRAQIGSVLDPADLLDIGGTIAAARRLKAFLQKAGEAFPLLSDQGSRIGIFNELEAEITRSIGGNGQVLDSASPELARLRSRRRSAEQRIQEKLNGLVAGPLRTLLQDPVVVQRNDRWCVPVKAEHRGAFGGIVHDTSSSGATLFIEPASVVEVGNEIREVTVQETQEVFRILAKLTGMVQQAEFNLTVTVEALGQIDFMAGRARYAENIRAVEPELNGVGLTRLLSARHPLIDSARVVATDIVLGSPENKILLITGPNTGGKTVSLKTVGLLTLMAQCGLHVPASHAEMNVFRQVFADIGDEQSIEQSLSTFSSHITQISGILNELRPNALVLMDEVGAGTDPEEGSALARALLEFFRRRDARVIATTHYGELKTYAFSTEGVQNASVEFDEATLRPTYRLLQGVPGSSHALAIAARLGLPIEVLDEARSEATDTSDATDILRSLEDARRSAVTDANAAELARQEAENLRRRAELQLTEYETLRREIRTKALEEARVMIRKAQEKSNNLVAEVRRRQADQAEAERTRQQIREVGTELEGEIEEMIALPEQPEYQETWLDRPLREGDKVRVTTLNLIGTLLADLDANGRVPVQVGALRVSVPGSSLRPVSAPERVLVAARPAPSIPRPAASEAASEAVTRAANASSQITLLGQRVDEAVRSVDTYLDEAYAGGVRRARLVHGKGTGALRRAIQDHLKDHPLVESFETAAPEEGGAGATIVSLKE
jgi:DNA mismatch repair protein MutS2